MIVRVLAALLLMQYVLPTSPKPEPQYFLYHRSLSVAPGVSGQACTVLDAAVLAHAAKQSLDDLRLYDATGKEKPYILTESGATRAADDTVVASNAARHGSDIAFDLRMPERPYTDVELNLDAHDFLASANVAGANSADAPVQLGSFALFDLTSRHLSRSTTLFLQESTFRTLHVTLHIFPQPRSSPKTFPLTIVKGATVPPSREAQTLYTTVANAALFGQHGKETVATFHIPAHVPVERFSFELDPTYREDFLRTVVISAEPDHTHDLASVETITGEISHTTLPSGAAGFVSGGKLTNMNVDAVLGADLREGATVNISIHDGDNAPLPLRAVRLQMRERRICFDANAGSAYTMRYGDSALKSPGYDYARFFLASASPAAAQLGPEQSNKAFRTRRDTRPYVQRHPEVFWLALIAVVALFGTFVMRLSHRR